MPMSDSSPALTLSLPQAFGLACKAAGPLKVRVIHRSTGSKQEHTIHSPFAFIGRSASAGIRLDDSSVSQGHAYLQIVEGVPFCIDLGSRTGVIWDDGTQGQGWVCPEQMLQIGVFDIRVESPGGMPRVISANDDPESDHEVQPILTPAAVEIHATANTPANVHPLDRAITLVGRHPSCDLRLLDGSIAYFQCALVNTADGVWLVDTMTRKGAVLNGRATRLARVRDGDLLELGKMSLLLRIGTHHGGQLALRTPSLMASPLDPVTAISTAVADSLAGALMPVGDMMKQFQQCYVAMAQMFSTMQQEHALLVGEQMRQIQELASELRDLRAEARHNGSTPPPAGPLSSTPAASPTTASPPPPTSPAPRIPTLKVPPGAEGQALSEAHAWFMERLANKGQTPPAGS